MSRPALIVSLSAMLSAQNMIGVSIGKWGELAPDLQKYPAVLTQVEKARFRLPRFRSDVFACLRCFGSLGAASF